MKHQRFVSAVEKQDSDSEEMYISELRATTDKKKSEWHETVQFRNDKAITMKVDTGAQAQCNVLPGQEASEAGLKTVPSKVKKIVSYTNHKFSVVGEAQELCEINGQRARLTFIVVDSPVTPVLGQTACETLNLVKRVRVIETPKADDNIFQGIGCIKDYVYEADIVEGAAQKLGNQPPRKVPYALMEEVKEAVDSMERRGIIKKVVKPTPFCSQMVVVKQNGKLRICLDPVELNKVLRRRHYPLKTLEEVVAQI